MTQAVKERLMGIPSLLGLGVQGAWRRPSADRLALAAVLLLMVAYMGVFGGLNLRRHEAFRTHAFDLGYYDQAVWNTLRGQPFRATTLHDASFNLDVGAAKLRDKDSTLALHVEPLLLLIGPIYLLRRDPTTLLLLQTAVIALGALPAFWLARRRLRSNLLGVLFALVYLLSPLAQGATVSDFYPVSLTAALLLYAFYFGEARRYAVFGLFALLALAAKEEISLIVAAMGLYIFFGHQQRRIGGAVALVGGAWFLLATEVIIPSYAGGQASPLLSRYSAYGRSLGEIATNLLLHPGLLLQRLAEPEIAIYLGSILATTGFMSLFHPATLVLAAPELAINILSNQQWMYSGGKHYAAAILPFVVISGIYGLDFASRWAGRWPHVGYRAASYSLGAFVFLSSAYIHYEEGVSPLARRFAAPEVTAHHRLAAQFMALIPPQAAVSASSGLYPHVSQREKIYLFPTVSDAEFVFFDATSKPYPLRADALRGKILELLESGRFGVVAASDGYILLRRGWPGSTVPPEFYSFARAPEAQVDYAVRATFGGELEFVGFSYYYLNEVNFTRRPASVTTYWRALKPLSSDYRFVFLFTRDDGAVVGIYGEDTPTTAWYATRQWAVGELVKVRVPALRVGDMRTVAVAVAKPGPDWGPANRLQPIVSAVPKPGAVVEQGTALKFLRFAQPGFWASARRPLEPVPATPTPPALPTPTPQPTPIPLTKLDRRPLAVVVENHPEARPQSGLDKADVVYEVLVEWGITRFMAIYARQEAAVVGPVRSIRHYFVHWAREYEAIMGHAGGSPQGYQALRSLGVPSLDDTYGKGYFWRSRERPAPHNLYTSTAELRKKSDDAGAGSLSGFVFKPDGTAGAVRRIAVTYPDGYRVSYNYAPEANAYLRSTLGRPHTDAVSGQQYRPKNVVVQVVESWLIPGDDAGRLDMRTVGAGPAYLFFDGGVVKGSWAKSSLAEPTRFLNGEGQVVPLNAGPTWIQVVPPKAQVEYE